MRNLNCPTHLHAWCGLRVNSRYIRMNNSINYAANAMMSVARVWRCQLLSAFHNRFDHSFVCSSCTQNAFLLLWPHTGICNAWAVGCFQNSIQFSVTALFDNESDHVRHKHRPLFWCSISETGFESACRQIGTQYISFYDCNRHSTIDFIMRKKYMVKLNWRTQLNAGCMMNVA